MPKLVGRNLKARRFVNPPRDLIAQRRQTFEPSAFAGEQPGLVGAAQQNRTELVNILIDQLGEVFYPV